MSVLRSATVLLAGLAAGTVLVAVPAFGAPPAATVMVVDNDYDDGDDVPRTTHVRTGDTVQWRWADDNQNRHTVTSEGDDFDSDAECDDDKAPCRSAGHRFEITFTEPGEYVYYCKVHDPNDPLNVGPGMQARIVVEQRKASPTPSPSPSEQESEPGSEPSGEEPSPADDPSPSPEDTDTSGEDTDGDDAATRERVSPRRLTARAPSRSRETFAPPSPGDEVRAVEVASPSFSPFPSPSPLPTGDEVEDLTVEIPGGQGSPPAGLVGLAIGALAVSGGALAKIVLFGSPW